MHRKTTFLLSALTFLSAVCLSFYLYLCLSSGRVLAASEFRRFSGAILWNTLLHSDESGGARTLHLAREALSNSVSDGAVEIGGGIHSFPLPKYSVRRREQSYLTFASFEELQDYFHRELPAAGWRHVEQMGAGHFFEGEGAKMVITHRFHLGTGISEFNVSVAAR
jgi:hypothetical protein